MSFDRSTSRNLKRMGKTMPLIFLLTLLMACADRPNQPNPLVTATAEAGKRTSNVPIGDATPVRTVNNPVLTPTVGIPEQFLPQVTLSPGPEQIPTRVQELLKKIQTLNYTKRVDPEQGKDYSKEDIALVNTISPDARFHVLSDGKDLRIKIQWMKTGQMRISYPYLSHKKAENVQVTNLPWLFQSTIDGDTVKIFTLSVVIGDQRGTAMFATVTFGGKTLTYLVNKSMAVELIKESRENLDAPLGIQEPLQPAFEEEAVKLMPGGVPLWVAPPHYPFLDLSLNSKYLLQLGKGGKTIDVAAEVRNPNSKYRIGQTNMYRFYVKYADAFDGGITAVQPQQFEEAQNLDGITGVLYILKDQDTLILYSGFPSVSSVIDASYNEDAPHIIRPYNRVP